MGAINTISNKHEHPKIANKINKYKCPLCEKHVIFKQGKINQPHFSHYKSDSPCYYYDKPSETEIHKEAKLLMKSLLDNKTNICINTECKYCEKRDINCPFNYGFQYYIFCDDYNENTKAVIEYKFYYNNSNRSADVALIENDEIKYIFEICYRNKTKEENRPEPWAEIDAENLINGINSGVIIDKEGNIEIECIRDYKCDKCIYYEREKTDLLEMLQIKEKEQMREKLEIINMKNEDIRAIEIMQRKIKEELIEKEEQLRIWKENKRKESENKKQEDERKWRESIKQKEVEKIKKEQENLLKQPCKCGIIMKNICRCENPKYELQINKFLYCINCNNWKCRCKR
jgi:hypothetical protein